jgi:hypothetical protein
MPSTLIPFDDLVFSRADMRAKILGYCLLWRDSLALDGLRYTARF